MAPLGKLVAKLVSPRSDRGNRLIRSQMLYPIELRLHYSENVGKKGDLLCRRPLPDFNTSHFLPTLATMRSCIRVYLNLYPDTDPATSIASNTIPKELNP